MTLFDKIVNEAIREQKGLAVLRPVVEKEILHHDILRELSAAGLLSGLTIGGTCLRACYGSSRLSEDLDFTGGIQFQRSDLVLLRGALESQLTEKYELPITVTEPKAEKQGNVNTWKLSVNTQPGRPDMPAQKIHLDICSVPSYQILPMTIRNHYGVNLGTESLIINAQSREEIFADKLVAFAMRPGRLKHRDLWDIAWLAQRGVDPALELISSKLADHGELEDDFLARADERLRELIGNEDVRRDFAFEMSRFIPPPRLSDTIQQPGFWTYLSNTVTDYVRQAQRQVEGGLSLSDGPEFRM